VVNLKLHVTFGVKVNFKPLIFNRFYGVQRVKIG